MRITVENLLSYMVGKPMINSVKAGLSDSLIAAVADSETWRDKFHTYFEISWMTARILRAVPTVMPREGGQE